MLQESLKKEYPKERPTFELCRERLEELEPAIDDDLKLLEMQEKNFTLYFLWFKLTYKNVSWLTILIFSIMFNQLVFFAIEALKIYFMDLISSFKTKWMGGR